MERSPSSLGGYPVAAALRAYPEVGASPTRPAWADEPWEDKPFLIFDTETTTDCVQTLQFGTYMVAELLAGRLRTLEEGVFHRDSLPKENPRGYKTFRTWAKRGRLRLLSRRDFIREVFLPIVYRARGSVVGFNLPFDLSRIAVAASPARRSGRGGFSLTLAQYQQADGSWAEDKYAPRVTVTHVDSTRALIRFTRPRDPHPADLIPPGEVEPHPAYAWRGRFLDLRTLAFALSARKHSLASALEAFGVSERKSEVEAHGVISSTYLDYARQDVIATAALLEALLLELREIPLDVAPQHVHSPATFGKGFLRAAGLKAPLHKFPTESSVLGMSETTYFGGRAEVRIRGLIAPIAYLDFLSMYPTVNSLLGTWVILTAARVEWRDATDEVRELLADVDLDACFRPALWKDLCFFAEVMPDGDILPLRTRYDGRNLGIGVNEVTASQPLLYAGPDLVASTILTGRPPRILRAWRPVPIGRQRGLRSVQLAESVEIDPTSEDLFKRLIEIRKSLRTQGLDPVEEGRLSQFLKTVANSGGYGVFAQTNVKDVSRAREFTLHGLRAMQTRSTKLEKPGPLSYPPVAALTTAGARLMVAMLEQCVRERGGGYAFCDTDSMAILASVDGVEQTIEGLRGLQLREVEEIVRRFEQLNPYDPDRLGQKSILEIEAENYEAGKLRQLYVYAISAKRYALLTRDGGGRFIVLKASEHGLGHLLNPTRPTSEDREWIRQAYQWWIDRDMGYDPPDPAWLDQPAIGRWSLSSPVLMRPFAALNKGQRNDDQVKPFNFLLTAMVAPLGTPVAYDPDRFRLVAPYASNLSGWRDLQWRDAYSGDEVSVTTAQLAPPSLARVLRMRDVLERHFTHPEAKSADASGRACGPETSGLLHRRRLHVVGVDYVGKESQHWEEVEAGLPPDPDEPVQYFSRAGSDRMWDEIIVLEMHRYTASELAQVAGVSARYIKALRNRRKRPSASVGRLLEAWILDRLPSPPP